MEGWDKWILTGYYGQADKNRREFSWELLRTLAGRSSHPWVCVGDYNDLLYQSDKRRGASIQLNYWKVLVRRSGIVI